MRWWWCEARAGGALASERVGSVLTAPLSLEARCRLRGRPHGIIQARRARLSPSQPRRPLLPSRSSRRSSRFDSRSPTSSAAFKRHGTAPARFEEDHGRRRARFAPASASYRTRTCRPAGLRLALLQLRRSCTTSGNSLLVWNVMLALERRLAPSSALSASLRRCAGAPARCAPPLARALDLGRNASSRNVD